ncbi:hypothetical protein V8E52_010579 [Russula decolorans]
MPARSHAQDISLTADTIGSPSPNMPQRLNGPPRESVRAYPETCRPYKNDGQEDRPDNFKLPPAPQIPTIALPKEDCEESEDLSCGGSESNLEGGLMVALYGDPESLDDIFPELLAIEKLSLAEFG